jgi:hypothetical protein
MAQLSAISEIAVFQSIDSKPPSGVRRSGVVKRRLVLLA